MMRETSLPPLKKNKRKPKGTKKAGNGQGSVRELPNGKWRWEVTLGYTLEGKRQSMSGVCANQTQAGIEKAKALADFSRGLIGASENITLSAYADKWLSRQKGLRHNTLTAYERELGYALKYLGKLKLKDVKPHHIRDCLTKLSETIMESGLGMDKPMSGRTLGMVRARLKAVFREAVIDQLLYFNPCDAVKRIKTITPESVGVALDFHEMTRLHELGLALYEAGVCRLFPAVFTAASVGLRRGEVMALRWQDVDFEKNIICVRQCVTTPKGGLHFGEPKTRHSKRDIPMPLTLKNILLIHREKQTLEQEKALDAWQDTDAVFATETGNYTHPDNLERVLHSIIEWSNPKNFTTKRCKVLPVKSRAKLEMIVSAGEKLPDLSPHDLRHTAATLMLRRSVPVEVVSRILGHSKVSVTLDIYRHVLDSEKNAVMVDLFDTPLPVRELPQVTLN
jgi:integrase